MLVRAALRKARTAGLAVLLGLVGTQGGRTVVGGVTGAGVLQLVEAGLADAEFREGAGL